MTGLASDFVEHSRQWTVQPDLVKRLMGEILDVECLIEKKIEYVTRESHWRPLMKTS